jgi:uncharacterized surface protein with fasciclin (FAS1) repeats
MKFALVGLASCATLAQLLAQDPQLSLASSLASRYPAWSDPTSQGTLIVARDASIRSNTNLPNGNYGIFYYNRTIVWHTVHYVILEGVEKSMKMVYDNYVPGNPDAFEVHIRGYGVVNQVLNGRQQADNGYLYIAPDPVIPVVLPTVNLPLIGSAKFQELINSLGMNSFIDKLDGITIFSPDDASFTAFEATLNTYTKEQKEAFVLNHIVPRVVYTTAIVPQINSLLGQPVTMRVVGERIRVNDNAAITTADNMMLSGVAQLLNGTLPPRTLTTEQPRVSIDGNTWPVTGSTNTTTGTPGATPGARSSATRVVSSLFSLFLFL